MAGAKTVYIDPALKTAEDIKVSFFLFVFKSICYICMYISIYSTHLPISVKESYVEPAVKMTQEYIAPVMIQAYNDPATAYGDMVQLGKEVATITKVIKSKLDIRFEILEFDILKYRQWHAEFF